MSPRNDKSALWPLLIAFLSVVFLWLGSVTLMNYIWNDWSKTGTVGDSFGAVNALFSGLALAGVIYAIGLQRGELRLQQHELEQAARDREKSATALLEQGRYLLLSARVSHLTALLEAYNADLERYNRGYPTFQKEANERAQQIEQVIRELETQFMEIRPVETAPGSLPRV